MLETKPIALLLALLPGLVTAELLHALTVREKREPLERVIQALLFTFLCHVTWVPVRAGIDAVFRQGVDGKPPVWSSAGDLVGLCGCAIAWGLIGALLVNSGALYRVLRWARLTKHASRPNQWYDAFYRTVA